jgi:uncharacterized protein YuzE
VSIRIEQYDGGEVLYIALDPDGIWAKSEFPDELVTVDYNARGGIIGIEAVGSVARTGATSLLDVLMNASAVANVGAVRKALEPVLEQSA